MLDHGPSRTAGLRSLEIRFPLEMFHVGRPASVPIDDLHETVGESAFFGQSHQFRCSPFRHVLLIGGVQKVARWQDAVVRPNAQERFKIVIRAAGFITALCLASRSSVCAARDQQPFRIV
jgi:hypothetical protein